MSENQKSTIHPKIIRKVVSEEKLDADILKSAIIRALISAHHLTFSASAERQVDEK